MDSLVYDTFTSPVGELYILMDEAGIREVGIGEDAWETCRLQHPGAVRDENRCQAAVVQLREYFAGQRREFTLPLSLSGEGFNRRVWEELRKIPAGETRSYGQLAAAVGNPRAARAVGQANRRNPIAIIIPCHRVIGSQGQMTGYMGDHTEIKRFLLQLEGVC